MKRLFSNLIPVAFLAVLALSFLGKPSISAAQVDNTTCSVLTGDDTPDQPGFNELRRKIVEGFNRHQYRMCTEKIQFGSGITVNLAAPLNINNDSDLDCPAGQDKPAVCGDGWGLILDGAGGTIDVTGIGAGDCAIEVNASRVKMVNLSITATAAQIEAGKVICDKGNNNDFSGVRINGQTQPSATPTPTPIPTPAATPTPTPTPLGVPSVLTAVIDPSSTQASLKVLLKWKYTAGSGGKIHIRPDLLGSLTKLKPNFNTDGFVIHPLMLQVNPGDLIGNGQLGPIDPGSVITPVLVDKDYNFVIERATKDSGSTTCGTFTALTTINGKYVSHQDATVLPSTNYCYRVQASRNSDHSAYSNVAEIRTPSVELAIPANLNATAVAEDKVHVGWTFTAEDTTDIGFQVERGNASCAPETFTSVTILTQDSLHPLADILEYTEEGLMPSTAYCYRVRAVHGTSEYSLYSNTDTATTLDPGATPLPTPVPTPTATPTATPSATATPSPGTDNDGDGVPNGTDNCPSNANADQRDLDGDHIGDVCDPDADGDGISNNDELAHGTDPLDADSDNDGTNDDSDNCPTVANANQADSNQDGRGDACASGNGNGNGNGNGSSNLPGGAAIGGGGGGFCSLTMVGGPDSVTWFYLGSFGLLATANHFYRSRKKK